MYKLPSLNALRAFEAAARKGSMKAAAAELFVTPGAISQQIKGLEESLGAPLFRRLKGGLTLTESGAALYPVLRESFEGIARALERLKRREQAGPLTVSVLPSFAAKWLVPRLGRFRERHPEIDVRISATPVLTDFSREDVDVGIRLGLGDGTGLRFDRLMTVDLFPVCAPRLLNGAHPLRRPEDLSFHTLLHDDSPSEWRIWLEMQGVQGVDTERGPVFNDAAMVVQASVEGQGVALTRSELVELDLAEGRLVRPFNLSTPSSFAYYVVCPEAVADWPKVVAFRDWLLQEVAGTRVPR